MSEIHKIFPYRMCGEWVFDDPNVDLYTEPFVRGMDVILDRATVDIPKAWAGFHFHFSAGAFDGFQFTLDWQREGDGGNWYLSTLHEMEGWLCPALYRYFHIAPKNIFVRIKPV